ncbi:MAG: hypothetical protein M0R06_25570 [Sphaerochaeta sp.]|jgi:hypothetical protein|nr:hypothetical protein [Sphaerochaeta sp.]
MSIYNRRTLRQSLGRDWLHDTIIGQTSGSWGTTAGSLNIVDRNQADPTASGEQLYYRHWLRLLGSAGHIQDVRVGSFNTGSGAYLAAVTAATTIYSGMPFEVHGIISPADKDRAIDAVIRDVRYRQELAIWAIDQGHIYSLGADVLDVIDVRYFSDPTDSLSRGEGHPHWFRFEQTASRNELRIAPSLLPSYQLVIDAILAPSLGAGDLATVNLPSDEWALSGAAARCYWMLEQRAPGQETSKYKERRQEAAREYTRLSNRFQPIIARKVQLDEPY